MAENMIMSYREKGDKWVEQVDTNSGTTEDCYPSYTILSPPQGYLRRSRADCCYSEEMVTPLSVPQICKYDVRLHKYHSALPKIPKPLMVS